jgi:hypothetical protein
MNGNMQKSKPEKKAKRFFSVHEVNAHYFPPRIPQVRDSKERAADLAERILQEMKKKLQ